MKLRTEIERIPLPRLIDRGEGIMLLGSCFTDHIGSWLEESWLPVMCNPWGVLFNPASIANALLRVIGADAADQYTNGFKLHEQNGRYYSFDHHGRWSGTDPQALTAQLQTLEQEVKAFLPSLHHCIITFGTSWVYEYEGKVVANCHKFPASAFTRRRLSIGEIVDLWSQVIESFATLSTSSHSSLFEPSAKASSSHQGHFIGSEDLTPNASFTFTVSPIRHVKDTLHGNQLSKSTLLLAIDELQRLYPDRVQYLPVYELLMDDLRDYRFYAEDLVHPSPLAIQAVRELVTDCAMTPRLRKYMQEAEPIVRALNHRPSDPESPQYKQFLKETLKKKEQLVQNL